jgi:hypothetical protein
MAKTLTNLGLMLAALSLILACATPLVTPQPPGFVETAIAGTYSVAESQTAQVKASQSGSKLLSPTASKSASATPFPTFTLVVLGPSEIRALVDVPCRVGPGSIYPRVFLLRKGQTADLVGRSADDSYLIIRNPNRPEQVCWVERAALQVNRISGNLPVMTPPPPPTPTRTPTRTRRPPSTSTFTPEPTSTTVQIATATATPVVQFDLVYNGLDDCATPPGWWINFELGNTGEVEFKSLSFTLTDNDTVPPTVMTFDSELFTPSDGCNLPIPAETLPIGFSLVVSSEELDYDPTGHHMDASITLCAGDTQSPPCVTRTMSIVP